MAERVYLRTRPKPIINWFKLLMSFVLLLKRSFSVPWSKLLIKLELLSSVNFKCGIFLPCQVTFLGGSSVVLAPTALGIHLVSHFPCSSYFHVFCM